MADYLLRAEAVNFDHFIYDTNQLSVMRGGGLMLLDAVQKLEAIAATKGWRTCMTAASVGLFEFSSPDAAAAAAERDAVALELRQGDLKHATFVVDVVARSEDYQADLARVTAANRWRQMQAPTLVYPAHDECATSACALDRLRPATSTDAVYSEGEVSESVAARLRFGRDRRQAFYEEELNRGREEGEPRRRLNASFTDDLEELSWTRRRDSDGRILEAFVGFEALGGLDGKLAVIHIDGNRFGDMARRLAASPGAHREVSGNLKTMRRDILDGLLARIETDALFHTVSEKPRLRLETLLWGGDEIVWVVPAWRAFDVLEHFFASVAPLRRGVLAGEPITHSAGVVIAHHKASIVRLRALAHDLLEHAKLQMPGSDVIAYEVMESFDDTGRDLEEHRRRRLVRGLELPSLLLRAERLAEARAAFRAIEGALPRSRVFDLARHLQRQGPASVEATESIARIDVALSFEQRRLLATVLEGLSDGGNHEHGAHPAWLHLAELWDYLAVESCAGEPEQEGVL